jgi:hypothetical protein
MVELQLLNLWLLKTTPKDEKEAIWWLEIHNMVRWVIRHDVTNIRPGSNCETWS